MSEIKAFLRFCPSCGQRFRVRLVGKELVGTDAGKATVEPAGGFWAGRTEAEAFGSAQLMVEEDEYQYSYKCKQCGSGAPSPGGLEPATPLPVQMLPV